MPNYDANGFMQNRIKELRDKRGWTMRTLAARMNTTSSTINKLEKGLTRLNIEWMKRFAEVFNVHPDQIVEFSLTIQEETRDNASLYDAEIEELNLSETQLLYLVGKPALDQRGIDPGMILIVETSPKRVAKMHSGDVVIAEHSGDMGITILLRQFIPPNLLITNSSEFHASIISTNQHDVTIKGVAVGAYRRFGSLSDEP